nr:phosphoribosyltransferase domain-containing protein [Kineosporia rhizophila]
MSPQAFAAAGELIAAREPKPDVIIGIARGGVPLAQLLADRYSVPALPVTARHNHSDDTYVPATGQVELPAEPAPALTAYQGARILLVDDICGTGATYQAALPWLYTHLSPAVVRTAALCRSRASAFTPDIWVWNTLDWVVFPWNDATPTTQDLIVPCEAQTHPGPSQEPEAVALPTNWPPADTAGDPGPSS